MSSLQERVAARRKQRAKERTFVLPVRGYEDLGLYVRYKVVGYEEVKDILTRDEGDLARFADTLIEACVEFCEKDGDDYQGLGCRWSSAAGVLKDKVGIEVPADMTARDNVFAVFNGASGGTDLAFHYDAWETEATRTAAELDEEQADLSEPSEEGSSNSEPTPSPEGLPSTRGSFTPAATLTS